MVVAVLFELVVHHFLKKVVDCVAIVNELALALNFVRNVNSFAFDYRNVPQEPTQFL